MLEKEEVRIDPLNIVFANVLKICTMAGLVVMIVFGLLYLFGVSPYLDREMVVQHWGKPVDQFWQVMRGSEVERYDWFLSNLGSMDSLSMVGLALLALAPLFAVLSMIPRSRKIYLLLLTILAAEFIFSIIKPLLGFP